MISSPRYWFLTFLSYVRSSLLFCTLSFLQRQRTASFHVWRRSQFLLRKLISRALVYATSPLLLTATTTSTAAATVMWHIGSLCILSAVAATASSHFFWEPSSLSYISNLSLPSISPYLSSSLYPPLPLPLPSLPLFPTLLFFCSKTKILLLLKAVYWKLVSRNGGRFLFVVNVIFIPLQLCRWSRWSVVHVPHNYLHLYWHHILLHACSIIYLNLPLTHLPASVNHHHPR